MSRFIAIILLSLLSLPILQANPKKSNLHGKSFSLERTVVVVAKRAERGAALQVVDILSQVGVTAKISSKSLFAKAKIEIHRVKLIAGAGGVDALQITVTPNVVKISYTSDQGLKKALDFLRRITDRTSIQGNDITDWRSEAAKPLGGVFDASSRMATMTQIETYARADRGREVYVQLVDGSNWRLESSVFAVINPKVRIYPTDGYYTIKQISGLADKLERSRITLIPVIDLINSNEPFQSVTGHCLNSVEGMRFVRAILEEYAAKLGCKKICIGNSAEDIDKRYLEFLYQTARRCSIEIIIKD